MLLLRARVPGAQDQCGCPSDLRSFHSSQGSLVDPRLRASNEDLQFSISLHFPLGEWPRLPFTARIGRAQFHRARSASKKGTWPLLPILLSVRVPRAGGRPGRPRLPSRTGDAIPALLSAFSGMFVLHSDTSRHAVPLSSRSHGGTHLIVNHF